MSTTITVITDDAEHTVTIDRNDNIIEKLEYMLGDIKQYVFTINNIQLKNASYFPINIPHNSTIIVKRLPIRGTAMSHGADAFFQLRSTKNPSRPIIQIHTIRISCSSDSYDPNKDFAGMIIYSFDDQQMFEFNRNRCRTGYILVKDSDKIDHVDSNQGKIHGKLFKWFFGCEHDERFVCAGFAIQKGRIKYNSSVFNCKYDDYHDDKREMGNGEIGLITYALRNLYMNDAWKSSQNMILRAF